jgi:hypothetical protein
MKRLEKQPCFVLWLQSDSRSARTGTLSRNALDNSSAISHPLNLNARHYLIIKCAREAQHAKQRRRDVKAFSVARSLVAE